MVITEEFATEFIPAENYAQGRCDKLIIVLHGRGDSLEPYRDIQEELELYDVNFLLLNAPRKYVDGYTWYAFPPNEATGVLKARRKLTALIEELVDQGWQRENLFLLGHSQGCLVGADFILNYPHRLGGVIGISGYIYFFNDWVKKLHKTAVFQTPWLMTHGTQDDALDIRQTRQHVKRLKRQGIPIQWQEFDKDHDFCFDHEVPLITSWVRSQIKDTEFRTGQEPFSQPTDSVFKPKESPKSGAYQAPNLIQSHSELDSIR